MTVLSCEGHLHSKFMPVESPIWVVRRKKINKKAIKNNKILGSYLLTKIICNNKNERQAFLQPKTAILGVLL